MEIFFSNFTWRTLNPFKIVPKDHSWRKKLNSCKIQMLAAKKPKWQILARFFWKNQSINQQCWHMQQYNHIYSAANNGRWTVITGHFLCSTGHSTFYLAVRENFSGCKYHSFYSYLLKDLTLVKTKSVNIDRKTYLFTALDWTRCSIYLRHKRFVLNCFSK